MAARHAEFLERGGRLFGMSADTHSQNSAVMEKLALTFPILSDPGRDMAISPLGFADDNDPRQISRPGTVIVSPQGEVVFSVTGRDYADRPDEDLILERLADMGLAPARQEPPELGVSEPGDTAVALAGLGPYFRGARAAVLAVRGRHRDLGEEFRADTKRYVQTLDRYMEALPLVEERRS